MLKSISIGLCKKGPFDGSSTCWATANECSLRPRTRDDSADAPTPPVRNPQGRGRWGARPHPPRVEIWAQCKSESAGALAYLRKGLIDQLLKKSGVQET